MPILPAGSTRFVESDGGSAARLAPLVLRETSPGFYDFTTIGAADLEIVDVSGTGVYTTPAAGTSPTAARLVARSIAGANIIVY